MNMNELAIRIAAEEGKLKSLAIGQIKEVVGLVADECAKSDDTVEMLIKAGRRRLKLDAKKPTTAASTAAARRKRGAR
jgi:hypothetical protein